MSRITFGRTKGGTSIKATGAAAQALFLEITKGLEQPVEKIFDKAMFKVNVSGSWANLVWCDASRYEAVKAACETLAQAAGHGIRFKAIDVAGGDLEHYGPLPNAEGLCGWQKSSRRSSDQLHSAVVDNPIQAGIDPTTSGAIGQP